MNKYFIELLSESELKELRESIDERIALMTSPPTAEEKISFEEKIKALELLISEAEVEDIKFLNKRLIQLEINKLANDYQADLDRLYQKLQCRYHPIKRWWNRLRGGRKRYFFRFVFIARKRVRSPYWFRRPKLFTKYY